MTSGQVKSEVLARLAGWHTVSETVSEVVTGPRFGHQQYAVSFTSQSNPASFLLKMTPKNGVSTEVVDNGRSTIEYKQGATHYAVAASNPDAWSLYRLTGPELSQDLKSSRVLAVSVTAKQVVLHLMMPVTPGITANTTLWFNLTSNLPSRLKASWKGGAIEETPVHIEVNPSVYPSTFAFSPPSGVTPQVAMTTQGTEIDQAQARVSFPIVLPPSGMNLDLSAVNVNSDKASRVVLLTYQTANQEPVVITESRASRFKPPAGISLVSETVGTLKVEVGSLPDGQVMAGFTVNKTLLVIEGPASTVDALVNGWADNASVGSSSP